MPSQTSVSPFDFPGLGTHPTAWVRACDPRSLDRCRNHGPGGRGARGWEQACRLRLRRKMWLELQRELGQGRAGEDLQRRGIQRFLGRETQPRSPAAFKG